ncbi:MAG: HD domain-containing protein [Planctomycetota bacterium]|nr:HD domain-containing protein [Planctomycetota bacterium]
MVLIMALVLLLASPSLATAAFCVAAIMLVIAPGVFITHGIKARASRRVRDLAAQSPSTVRSGHEAGGAEAGPASAIVSTPTRVIVCDSDPRGRRDCRRVLEPGGFEILEAPDGQGALSKARAAPPDVIILDSELAKPDALECARRLKGDSATCRVPLILLSNGVRGDDEIEAALAAGVDGFATTPIRELEFLHYVKTMQLQHRGMLELQEINKLHAEHQRAMQLVFDYSRSLGSVLTLGAVLAKTVSVAAALTRCRRVSILLPDDRKENLVVASSFGFDESTVPMRIPMCSAMAGKVYQSLKPIIINSRGPSDDVQGEFDSAFFTNTPLVCAPMRAAAKSIGILNLTEREGDQPFASHELEHIYQICNMAANAIANIRSCKARDGARDSIVEVLGLLAEYRDDNTGRHIDRVTQYSVLLAEELQKSDAYRNQIDERFLRNLPRAVPLHDIGKVGIPDRILLQPRKLTKDEMDIMKLHVDIGVSTIRSLRDRVPGAEYLKMAEEIAASHHEWFNGNGYPKGLRDKAIPLAARIVALADVYDALTTARPYKPAFSHAEAFAMLLDASGTQFDPSIVGALRKRQHQFKVLAEELADPHSAGPDEIAKMPRREDEAKDENASCYSLAPM